MFYYFLNMKYTVCTVCNKNTKTKPIFEYIKICKFQRQYKRLIFLLQTFKIKFPINKVFYNKCEFQIGYFETLNMINENL